MKKVILAGALLVFSVAAASAASTPEQERACKSDATRHCRKVMKEGDDAVLQCLKDVRDKLSSGCKKVLEDSGN